MTKRKLANWIEGYCEYTADFISPPLFKKWSGIAAVAGALERKVWATSKMGPLYPNLYTILICPPGLGKTVLVDTVWKLWDGLEEHHVGSSSMTHASLVDELKESERKIIRPKENPSYVSFNSLLISVNEIGVFLPAYEADLMSKLTDMYDCKHYSESRRGKDMRLKMRDVQLNLLAGGTPAYFRGTMPEGAWDQGFLSRCMLIYSEDFERTDIFDADDETNQPVARNGKLFNELQHDLQHLGTLYGQATLSRDAKIHINEWHKSGGPPRPDHPRLSHYNSRRSAHVIKLSIIAAMANHDHLKIELDDVQQALDWLIEAESCMMDLFKAMSTGGDAKVMDEAWHGVYIKYMKSGKPVPEQFLIQFLSERVPAQSVLRIKEIMEKTGIVKNEFGDLTPKPRKAL